MEWGEGGKRCRIDLYNVYGEWKRQMSIFFGNRGSSRRNDADFARHLLELHSASLTGLQFQQHECKPGPFGFGLKSSEASTSRSSSPPPLQPLELHRFSNKPIPPLKPIKSLSSRNSSGVIYASNAHTSAVWTQQKRRFFQEQSNDVDGNSSDPDDVHGNRNDEFSLHLLRVHAKCCAKPACRSPIDGDIASRTEWQDNPEGNFLSETDRDAPDGWISEERSHDPSHDPSHDDTAARVIKHIKTEPGDDDGSTIEDSGLTYHLGVITESPGIMSPDVSHDHATDQVVRSIKIEMIDEAHEGIVNQSIEDGVEEKRLHELSSPEGDGAQHSAADFMGPSCSVMSEDLDTESQAKSGPMRCSSLESDLNPSQSDIPSEAPELTRTSAGNRSCTVCSRSFYYVRDLHAHMKTHEKRAKNHKCNVCSKTFLYKSDFERHKRMHTREKPYQCSICLNRFTQRQHLNHHMKLHAG